MMMQMLRACARADSCHPYTCATTSAALVNVRGDMHMHEYVVFCRVCIDHRLVFCRVCIDLRLWVCVAEQVLYV